MEVKRRGHIHDAREHRWRRSGWLSSACNEVGNFRVIGEGLSKAVAGRDAAFRIQSQDDFGNLCDISQLKTMEYGLALVFQGSDGKTGDGGGNCGSARYRASQR